MSFVLLKHQHYIANTVSAYQEKIEEIEGDLRMRAMANNTPDAELALLRRLKEECAAALYRYQNLKEAFKAVVGDNGPAPEGVSREVSAAGRLEP